jgi:secreted trypsin-like serine protease
MLSSILPLLLLLLTTLLGPMEACIKVAQIHKKFCDFYAVSNWSPWTRCIPGNEADLINCLPYEKVTGKQRRMRETGEPYPGSCPAKEFGMEWRKCNLSCQFNWDPEDCGEHSVSRPGTSRIVGGKAIKYGDVPYQVNIVEKEDLSQSCGGSLIHPFFVLTAAHCFDNNLFSYTFGLATNDSHHRGYDKVFIDPKRMRTHPGYDGSGPDDIALVMLEKPATLKSTIHPICLPNVTDSFNLTGKMALVTGFGTTEFRSPFEDTVTFSPTLPTWDHPHPLLGAWVPILSNEVCEQMHHSVANGEFSDFSMPDTDFCAGLEEGGKDSCQGDSGGPVAIFDGGVATVVGVVSRGYGCGYPGLPGQYARVDAYFDWIYNNMEYLGKCDNDDVSEWGEWSPCQGHCNYAGEQVSGTMNRIRIRNGIPKGYCDEDRDFEGC